MNNYTQFDWAADRYAQMTCMDEEERLFARIDRQLNKRKANKSNKRNHRNYA